MTDDRMALVELLQKSGDSDFLRAVAEAVLQILMEADVEGLIGAGRHERSDDVKGFVILPRQWVVKRTFSWVGRNRRLAKDFENLAETLATFVTLASIQLAIRRLAKGVGRGSAMGWTPALHRSGRERQGSAGSGR
jgi:hypothetical protein